MGSKQGASNSGDKKASDTAADTTAAKKDSVPPAPTVASGPVMIMNITHEVANYAKWKSAYDEHDSSRLLPTACTTM